jgi:hypothetical protein
MFEGSIYTFLCSYIQMVSSSEHALDSKHIHKQLHDDLDSYYEFSKDSDIDIFQICASHYLCETLLIY